MTAVGVCACACVVVSLRFFGLRVASADLVALSDSCNLGSSRGAGGSVINVSSAFTHVTLGIPRQVWGLVVFRFKVSDFGFRCWNFT